MSFAASVRERGIGSGWRASAHYEHSERVSYRVPGSGLTCTGMTPGELHEAVENAFNDRDVDALVALYEDDAWLFGVAGPVQGTQAIRAAWTEMLAMAEQTRLVTQYVVEQGNIALLSNRWTSTVDGADISATSAEVARRQSDGTWKYVIDNPDAAGVLAG